MSRILLVHNYYRTSMPSGENTVFEQEERLLRSRGHDVEKFVRESDQLQSMGKLGKIKAGFTVPWNTTTSSDISRKVQDFRPDIVHVHNTFPMISPSIFSAIGNQAAVVLTLHNYRIFCSAAIPMRSGSPCTECLDRRSAIPAIRYGCYRGSRLATFPIVFGVELHRRLGTWRRHVDAFITFSEFQHELVIDAGLPADRVHVKPNFYPGRPFVQPWFDREPYVIFAGRLTAEKGVVSLLQAWQAWGPGAPELRLAGEGDLRPQLERLAVGLPVRFLGQLSAEEAQAHIAGAKLQILPSECFEGFPMVVREAFAFGTPAAVSDIGPLPSIVRDGHSGVVFPPKNPLALLDVVRRAWETPGLLERLGQGARAEFEDKYTEEANYATLMGIYERAMEVSRNG